MTKSINAIACALRSQESAADSRASLINKSNACWRYVNNIRKRTEWEELSRVVFYDYVGLSRNEFAFKNDRYFTHERKSSVVWKRISIVMRETSHGWQTRVLNERSLCDRWNRFRNDRMSLSSLQTQVFRYNSRLEFNDTRRSSAENSSCVISFSTFCLSVFTARIQS